MDFRIAVCRQLDLVVRQVEERSTNPAHRTAHWFCIVDLDATAGEGEYTLKDGSVVLGVSATEADAKVVAALDGLDVVYYTELSEEALAHIFEPFRQESEGLGRE